MNERPGDEPRPEPTEDPSANEPTDAEGAPAPPDNSEAAGEEVRPGWTEMPKESEGFQGTRDPKSEASVPEPQSNPVPTEPEPEPAAATAEASAMDTTEGEEAMQGDDPAHAPEPDESTDSDASNAMSEKAPEPPAASPPPPPVPPTPPVPPAPTGPPPDDPGDGARTGPAWEDWRELGIPSAAFDTIKAIFTDPGAAFATMRRDGGLGTPLLFSVIVGWIASILGQGGSGILHSLPYTNWGTTMGGTGTFAALAYPFIAIPFVFLGAGWMHLCLKIVSGDRQPFEATFRTACYVGGAMAVWQILPLCGAVVGSLHGIYVSVFAYSAVHEISESKALGAIVLTWLLCCMLLTVPVLLLGGVGAIIGMAG